MVLLVELLECKDKTTFEGEELEAKKIEHMLHVERKYAELGFKLELKGIESIEGKDAYKMVITDPKGKSETTYFDVESGLKVQTVMSQETPMGPMTATVTFKDYKEVGGFKFPHSITQSAGPQTMDMKVSENQSKLWFKGIRV